MGCLSLSSSNIVRTGLTLFNEKSFKNKNIFYQKQSLMETTKILEHKKRQED
jgi:hypothetical protein